MVVSFQHSVLHLKKNKKNNNYWHSGLRSTDCGVSCVQAKEKIPPQVGMNKSLQVRRVSAEVTHNQRKGEKQSHWCSPCLEENPCCELIENLERHPFLKFPWLLFGRNYIKETLLFPAHSREQQSIRNIWKKLVCRWLEVFNSNHILRNMFFCVTVALYKIQLVRLSGKTYRNRKGRPNKQGGKNNIKQIPRWTWFVVVSKWCTTTTSRGGTILYITPLIQIQFGFGLFMSIL